MAVRVFDGTDDEVRFSNPPDLTGAFTLAVFGKRTNNTDYQCWVSLHNTGGSGNLTLEIASNGGGNAPLLDIAGQGSSSPSGMTVTAADGYVIIVVTKTTGSVLPRFHKYVASTDTWTHANGTNALNNASTVAGGSVRFGEYQDIDDWPGKAALGLLDSTAWSDAEVEALTTGKTITAWTGHAQTPLRVWRLGDATPTDLMGAGDTATINGTTVDNGDDPAGWTLGGTPSASGPSAATLRLTASPAGRKTGRVASASTLRLATAAAGRKTAVAGATATLRAAAACSGRKTAIGAHEEPSPSPPFFTLVEGATARLGLQASATGVQTPSHAGPSSAILRFTAAAAGRKTGGAVGVAALRLVSAVAGRKTGRASAASSVRFTPSAQGAQQGQGGPAAALIRLATAVLGRKTGQVPSSSSLSFATASAGRKTGRAPSASSVRVTVTAAGSASKAGAAAAPVRLTSAAAGSKRSTGAAAATLRLATAATGTDTTPVTGPSASTLRLDTAAAGRKTGQAASTATLRVLDDTLGSKTTSGPSVAALRLTVTVHGHGPSVVRWPVNPTGRLARPTAGHAS